jgi:HD-GYP domain-containing protein (c-di-GMP phosphodiesterase class II)
MMELTSLSDFVHVLEDVLEDIRGNDLEFDSRLSDVVLLCMERAKNMAAELLGGNESADAGLELLSRTVAGLAGSRGDALTHAAKDVLRLLDPDFVEDQPREDHQMADLEFFRKLVVIAEQRSPYWNGRYKRILALAMDMNREAGQVVDPLQLEAAVYMHDVGMAFLPLAILHKDQKLSASEMAQVQSHAQIGAELVGNMQGWAEAEKMIAQHHERQDGSGYPSGLSAADICAGAKILAIVDTFDAMTNERADRNHKRPLVRAILEINDRSGSQFSPEWVETFNAVIRRRKSKKST